MNRIHALEEMAQALLKVLPLPLALICIAIMALIWAVSAIFESKKIDESSRTYNTNNTKLTSNFTLSIRSIRELISNNQSLQAIDVLMPVVRDTDVLQQLTVLNARQQRLNQEVIKDIISASDRRIEQNKIDDSLNQIIEKIDFTELEENNIEEKDSTSSIDSRNDENINFQSVVLEENLELIQPIPKTALDNNDTLEEYLIRSDSILRSNIDNEKTYFIHDGAKIIGEYKFDEISTMPLKSDHFIWYEGIEGWMSIIKFKEITGLNIGPIPPPFITKDSNTLTQEGNTFLNASTYNEIVQKLFSLRQFSRGPIFLLKYTAIILPVSFMVDVLAPMTDLSQTLGVVAFLAIPIAFISFLIWLNKSYSLMNSYQLACQANNVRTRVYTNFDTIWIFLSWIVPIVNFFYPYGIVKDIWYGYQIMKADLTKRINELIVAHYRIRIWWGVYFFIPICFFMAVILFGAAESYSVDNNLINPESDEDYQAMFGFASLFMLAGILLIIWMYYLSLKFIKRVISFIDEIITYKPSAS